MAALHKYRYPLSFCLGLLGSVPASGIELTVQIGAFGDRPNPAFAEQAATYGELLVLRGDDGITRVSIGRYDNKSAAREALQRLQINGYPDAYIANVRGRGTEVAPPASAASAADRDEQATVRAAQTDPVNQTTTQSAPRVPTTPEGRPIVAPKQPIASADSSVTQAGRFRLRTHDTQSGKTSDVQLAGGANPASVTGAVVTGLGANEIPQHLRDKLVYLDGVPHIKDGESFTPLNDAIDGK